MQKHIEHITFDNQDDWLCLCGNTPVQQYFFPVNEEGDEVEPTPSDWTTGEYICAQCGRIITLYTGAVTRQRDPSTIRWLTGVARMKTQR